MLLVKGWRRDAAGMLYTPEADAGGDAPANGEPEGGSQSGAQPGGQSGRKQPQTIEEAMAELEATRESLRLANKEAGDRRKKLEQIEEAERKRKEAEQSEIERAQSRAAKAEEDLKSYQARYQKKLIETAIRTAAAEAKFADPADALALADLSSVTVTDDEVTGAKEVVAALAKAKPHLIKAEKPLAPNTNSGSGGAPIPITVEALAQRKKATGQYTPY